MLVDALAVCLPDDPEGNAKLMFSILECLPKGNRVMQISIELKSGNEISFEKTFRNCRRRCSC
jgi:hypothetical protein